MADAVCPFCQSTGVELRRKPIASAAPALQIVRCSACVTLPSVLQGRNLRQALNQRIEQIRELKTLMTDIHRRLIAIEGRIGKIMPRRVAI